MHCSLPGSSVHGISLIRILEWVAISFSRGTSWPRDQTFVSCIAGISLHCRPIIYQLSHQDKPYVNNYLCPANSSVAFWAFWSCYLFIYFSAEWPGLRPPPPPRARLDSCPLKMFRGDSAGSRARDRGGDFQKLCATALITSACVIYLFIF